ncbi:MAG: type II secretion system protein J [Candidatus Saccharimonadales bacterium]
MLLRKLKPDQKGFTIPELVLVMAISIMVSLTFLTFFTNAFKGYLGLQSDGTAFSELASQSQRVAAVLRGLTDITEASADDITIYGYFFPSDTYVSYIHYYKNAAGTILYADVTPMTANPPIGTQITSETKTYTIISNLYKLNGVSTFVYLDSLGNPLPTPIASLHSIKGITINLAAPQTSQNSSGNASLSLEVSLRNRKSNL